MLLPLDTHETPGILNKSGDFKYISVHENYNLMYYVVLSYGPYQYMTSNFIVPTKNVFTHVTIINYYDYSS